MINGKQKKRYFALQGIINYPTTNQVINAKTGSPMTELSFRFYVHNGHMPEWEELLRYSNTLYPAATLRIYPITDEEKARLGEDYTNSIRVNVKSRLEYMRTNTPIVDLSNQLIMADQLRSGDSVFMACTISTVLYQSQELIIIRPYMLTILEKEAVKLFDLDADLEKRNAKYFAQRDAYKKSTYIDATQNPPIDPV